MFFNFEYIDGKGPVVLDLDFVRVIQPINKNAPHEGTVLTIEGDYEYHVQGNYEVLSKHLKVKEVFECD